MPGFAGQDGGWWGGERWRGDGNSGRGPGVRGSGGDGRGEGAMRILGLAPGLRRTGWGVIDVEGNRLRHVANGVVESTPAKELAHRLVELHTALTRIVAEFAPAE